jgi:hypothetical protein
VERAVRLIADRKAVKVETPKELILVVLLADYTAEAAEQLEQELQEALDSGMLMAYWDSERELPQYDGPS